MMKIFKIFLSIGLQIIPAFLRLVFPQAVCGRANSNAPKSSDFNFHVIFSLLTNIVFFKIKKFQLNLNQSEQKISNYFNTQYEFLVSNTYIVIYPFITFWLECVATTLKGVVATHSNQKVIKGYVHIQLLSFSRLRIVEIA